MMFQTLVIYEWGKIVGMSGKFMFLIAEGHRKFAVRYYLLISEFSGWLSLKTALRSRAMKLVYPT